MLKCSTDGRFGDGLWGFGGGLFFGFGIGLMKIWGWIILTWCWLIVDMELDDVKDCWSKNKKHGMERD